MKEIVSMKDAIGIVKVVMKKILVMEKIVAIHVYMMLMKVAMIV